MFTDAPVMTTQVVSRKTFKSVADGLVLGVAAIGIAERGAVMMRVRRSAERSLLITCVLGLTLIVGSPSPVRAVIVSFDYTATLFDPYGTIPSGDTLTGSFSYNTDSGTGLGIPGISVNVNHATAGSLSSTNVSINVFNDGFGGTIDAIAIQGFSLSGTLGGVAPNVSSSIVLDFRGPTSVLSSTALPSTAATYNEFTTSRILQLPNPLNPGNVSVANIGDVSPIPEPSTLLLLGSGLAGLGFFRRRRKTS